MGVLIHVAFRIDGQLCMTLFWQCGTYCAIHHKWHHTAQSRYITRHCRSSIEWVLMHVQGGRHTWSFDLLMVPISYQIWFDVVISGYAVLGSPFLFTALNAIASLCWWLCYLSWKCRQKPGYSMSAANKIFCKLADLYCTSTLLSYAVVIVGTDVELMIKNR